MVLDEGAVARRVYTGEVTDVIAILLQPLDHGVFRTEDPGVGFLVESSGIHRTVVADLKGTVVQVPDRAGLAIEAAGAVVVVSLPSLIGSLIEDVGVTRVISDDKDNMAAVISAVAGVVPEQMSNVHSRNSGSGHLP